MFHPKSMSKVFITATKQHLPQVIKEMYHLNLIHVEDFIEHKEGEIADIKIGKPLQTAETDSVNLIKIRSILSAFKTNDEIIENTEKIGVSEIHAWINTSLPEIIRDVEATISHKTQLDLSKKEIEQKILALTPFIDTPYPMEILCGYDSISILAGYVQKSVKILVQHEIYEKLSGFQFFVIIAVRITDRESVEKELLTYQFQKISIPVENGYAGDLIKGYEQEIIKINRRIETIDQNLIKIREKYYRHLLSSEENLRADVEQAEAPLRFATTELTFSVTGWIPSDRVSELFQRLDTVTVGKIYTTEIETDDYNNDPPVEFNNPRFAHPTELFLDLMSRPKYTEIDPTILMAVMYPLMFGLILGDVGYGIIILIMSLWLRRVVKGNETGLKLLKTLTYCSLSGIGFGVLFSEFFGFKLPWEPIGFSRHIPIGVKEELSSVHHSSSIPELLVISIWIGIIHISLGWIWGIRNAAIMEHGHHRLLKIYANIGWLSLLWGMLLMIWSKFPILLMPDLTGFSTVYPGITIPTIIGAMMILGGLICIARDDPIELFEVPTKSISHVLSYTRLIAVGLSSVAIAMVVNYIAIDLIIKPQLVSMSIIGVLLIITGIGIFLLGHTVNTILGILGGGLHPLRLHYVEFFTKFYRGGGKKYTPFGINRYLTEED